MLSAHLYGNSKVPLTGSMLAVGCREIDNHEVDTSCYDDTTDCDVGVHDIPYSCNNPFWYSILIHPDTR
jgi:hypothetical protein